MNIMNKIQPLLWSGFFVILKALTKPYKKL